MCLTSPLLLTDLSPEARVNYDKKQGWKTFDRVRGRVYPGTYLCFKNRDYYGSRLVPRDRWIQAEGTMAARSLPTGSALLSYTDKNETYPNGFHVYLTKPRQSARLVRWRDALALGYEHHAQCVVAEWLYV